MKYLLKIIPVIAFLAMSLTSCLKDDLSDCPPKENVILRFHLADAMGNDIFRQRIANTEVEIFTAAGDFVASHFLEQTDLMSFQGIKMNLAPGTYRIVCWGGIHEYSILDKGSNIDLSSLLHSDRSQSRSENDDPMYYAPRIADMANPDASAFILNVPERESVERTIEFTGAHKTIEIFVKGFYEDYVGIDQHCPKVEVTNLASAYNFRLQVYPDLPLCFAQRSNTTSDPQMAAVRFNTALFENDNNIDIHIQLPSSGASVYTVNLKQFLINNNITLTPGDHDLIQILVEFKPVGVMVSLPNWNDKDVEPEF